MFQEQEELDLNEKLTRRIYDLGHALFTSTLTKEKSSGGCMCKDMSSRRLSSVNPSEEGTRTRIRHDLIGL
jgi:hypothetical protein